MDINKTRIENLKILLDESNSLNELAQKADTAPSYLSQLKNGTKTAAGNTRKLGDQLARNLENAMGKPPFWMDSPHLNYDNVYSIKEPPAPLYNPDLVTIKKLSAEGGQGHGMSDQINHDEVISQIEVTKNYIKNNLPSCTSADNLRIITGRGRSMQPLYNDGEPLVVDIGVKTLEYDAVFVLWHDGELIIKNVQRQFKNNNKSFLLIPENNAYQTVEITDKDNFQVVGLVLGSFVFNKF